VVSPPRLLAPMAVRLPSQFDTVAANLNLQDEERLSAPRASGPTVAAEAHQLKSHAAVQGIEASRYSEETALTSYIVVPSQSLPSQSLPSQSLPSQSLPSVALPARLELELQDDERAGTGNTPTAPNQPNLHPEAPANGVRVLGHHFGSPESASNGHEAPGSSDDAANTINTAPSHSHSAADIQGAIPMSSASRQRSFTSSSRQRSLKESLSFPSTAVSSAGHSDRRSRRNSGVSHVSHVSSNSNDSGKSEHSIPRSAAAFGRKLMRIHRQDALRFHATPVVLQDRDFYMRMREAAEMRQNLQPTSSAMGSECALGSETNFVFEPYTVADTLKAADIEAIIERYSRRDGTSTPLCATSLDNIRDKILPLYIVRATRIHSSPLASSPLASSSPLPPSAVDLMGLITGDHTPRTA